MADDISELSDEELFAMLEPSTSTDDISSLSDEELFGMLEQPQVPSFDRRDREEMFGTIRAPRATDLGPGQLQHTPEAQQFGTLEGGGFDFNAMEMAKNFFPNALEVGESTLKSSFDALKERGANPMLDPHSGLVTLGLLKEPTTDTGKGFKELSKGFFSKMIPGRQASEDTFDALAGMMATRYGSIDGYQQFLQEKPVEALMDLSTIFQGAGLLSKGASLSKILKMLGRKTDLPTRTVEMTGELGKIISQRIGQRDPFRRSIDPELEALFKKQGIEPPLSAISDSPTTQLAEATSAKGLFGQKIVDKVTKANEELVQGFKKMIDKSQGTADDAIAGNNIIEDMQKAKRAQIDKKNKAFEDVKDAELDVIPIDEPTDVTAFLDILINKKTRGQKLADIPGIKAMVEKMKRSLTPKVTKRKVFDKSNPFAQPKIVEDIEQLSAFDLREGLKTIGDKMKDPELMKTNAGAEIAKLDIMLDNKLIESIRSANPKLADSLALARETHAQGLQKLNGELITKVHRMSKTPDKIIEKVILNDASDIQGLKDLRSVMEPDTLQNVQATAILKLQERAQSTTGKGLKASGLSKLDKQLQRQKLEVFLDPDQIQMLDELSELSRAMSKAGRITQGSQTEFIRRLSNIVSRPLLAGLAGAGAGGAVGGIGGALVGGTGIAMATLFGLIAGDAALAKLLKGFTFTGKTGQNIFAAASKAEGITPASAVASKLPQGENNEQ